MKTSITVLLTLVVLTAWGQNQPPKSLGIGFAIATDPYAYEVSTPNNLFIDKELTKKWTSEKIFPFFFKPDYGLYHFICLERKDGYYKILANDTEIAYLPNDTNYYFKTWDAILLNATVERLTKDNPIRQSWNDESETIKNDCDFDRLIVQDAIQKDGDYWLQIYFSPDCEDYPDQDSKAKYGWIRWRNGDTLLVNILLLC